MRRILILLFLLSTYCGYSGIPYKGKGGKIKDAGSGVYLPLTLSGVTPAAINDTFGLEAIIIKMTHPDVSQLEIWLKAPDGTLINLYDYNTTGKNFDSTIFSDTGTININMAKAPFRGSYKAYNYYLKTINNGQNPNGTWNLLIVDKSATSGRGTLNYWYLTFGNRPAADVKLYSSNLAIININTMGAPIYAHYKTSTYIDLIYNPGGKRNYLKDSLLYRNYAAIDVRGASSTSFPKLSYGFEMHDSIGGAKNLPVLGMPKGKDWVLIANYTDKTLLHNYLSYQYSRDMGHYASRTQMAEVVLNGVYQGIYLVGEKISVGKDRVNITKSTTTDTTGDALTGGYIVKKDWINGKYLGGWNSRYVVACYTDSVYYQYDAPTSINILQKNYVHKYVDSFEAALKGKNFQDTSKGWRKYGRENTFVDYFLVNELSKSVDGFILSTFFYKDRRSVDGGKINMGPVWDFDLSWNNANYRNGYLASGWQYIENCYYEPFWWSRLLSDSSFKNSLKCRWSRLRKGFLRDSAILGRIDSMATYLGEAQKRNFNQWNILGEYTWPNPINFPTYASGIDSMKAWVKRRTAWMDRKLPGTCRIDYTPPVVKLISKDTAYLEVFNHYKDSGITYNDNRDGKNVKIDTVTNLDTSSPGKYLYIYRVTDKSGNKTTVYRSVIVIDTISPDILFTAGDSINLEVFNKYTGMDVMIKDNYDPKPLDSSSGNFAFKNNIADSIGWFYLNYYARDHSGNKTFATRYIHVIDTIPPQIMLRGQDSISIPQNSFYIDSGYTVTDNYDRQPIVDTSGIFINTKNAGRFYIQYLAKDHAGNTGNRVKRIILVSATTNIQTIEASDNRIILFPNPTTGNLTLQLNPKEEETDHIFFYDPLGKKVPGMEYQFKGKATKQLNFPESCPPGIYYLKLQSQTYSEIREVIYLK